MADGITAVQNPDATAFSTGDARQPAQRRQRRARATCPAAGPPRPLLRGNYSDRRPKWNRWIAVLSREGRPSDGSSRHNRKVGIRAGLRARSPRDPCEKKSRSRQPWSSDSSAPAAAVSWSARWWPLSWAKQSRGDGPADAWIVTKAQAGSGPSPRSKRSSARTTAVRRIQPREAAGRCCCLTP